MADVPPVSPAPPDLEVPPTSGWPPWVEMWIMPFLRESGLWPVLVALLGHVVIVIAPLTVGLARGNRAMALPLTLLILLSFALCRAEYKAEGRLAGVTLVVALVWLVSMGVGYAAAASGVF